MNRLSVVGEAKIGGLAHLISEPYYNYILHNYEFNRISDILDPLKTNNGYDDLVTLNRTLWQSVDNYSPTYYYNYAYNEYISFNPIFTDSTNKQLSVKYFTPDGQKFFHPVAKQDSVHYITISASIDILSCNVRLLLCEYCKRKIESLFKKKIIKLINFLFINFVPIIKFPLMKGLHFIKLISFILKFHRFLTSIFYNIDQKIIITINFN